MFVCKECHDAMKIPCPFTWAEEIFLSYGKCETCGKVAGCYDCKAHHNPQYQELMRKEREKNG